ncbi:MAG: hypothetical protein JNM52_06250 [Betaproteobacteria bacterium]|nr:hypothetical protein [Betaproteobacteria bacterium]
MSFTRLIVVVVILALLAACSASPEKKRMTDVAVTPLNDLNLVRTDIPPILVEAQKQPYLVKADATCALLAEEVQALAEVLGPDVDAAANKPKAGLMERGQAEAENAAFGALRGMAEGIIPYRGWVRRLSGAERYSKTVAAAVSAGTARRAFLKGYASARGCTIMEDAAD